MLNSNDFDKGYKDGLTQAREGRQKNFLSFSKLKAFFSSNALETYIDGVNQGYLDGLKEKNLVHQTAKLTDDTQRDRLKQEFHKQAQPASKGNPMNPIIAHQIETLRNLKAFLNQFNEHMQSSSERYQKFLDDLADQQLDAQIYERYQSEFLDETKSRIASIISKIETEDIPYIERLVGHLEETPI